MDYILCYDNTIFNLEYINCFGILITTTLGWIILFFTLNGYEPKNEE